MAGKARDESARQRQLAGLKPVKPGEVRNPTGKNQWTYRREFEAAFAKAASEHGPELVRILFEKARRADRFFFEKALERMLPKVERHEVEADVGLRADAGALAALEDRLARIAGAGPAPRDPDEPDQSGSEGAQ